MDRSEVKKAILELRTFTSRHLERPSECRNPDQIRFYINELCSKIQELEKRFNYVPSGAHKLLAQYNEKQKALLQFQTRNTIS